MECSPELPIERQPKLSRLSSGHYVCDYIDAYHAVRGDELSGMEGLIISTAGSYLKTVPCEYPIPRTLDVPIQADNGQTYLVTFMFAELWMELIKPPIRIFAVFDSTGRIPSAHRIVDH